METNFLSVEEKLVVELLISLDQGHLCKNMVNYSKQQRNEFVEQVNHLNNSYPGGLKEYISRAKKLLKDSANNVNPYDGYKAFVPIGHKINFENFDELNLLEVIGLNELKNAAFVLLGGGLGERLGYPGIKPEIIFEIITNLSFLRYYIEYILAFQIKSGADEIPLAILVSPDTQEKTEKLIKENNFFGMKKKNAPCFVDNDAKFALKKDSFKIETKPHGHGDVHRSIYMSKILDKWIESGKKWIIIFQDTNPLVFRSYPAVLGVSKKMNLEVNSITIPRKPGEAVGAICQLKHALTINVEYNQIDALFKGEKEPVDDEGYSKYPGNTNSLVFSVPEYYKTLQKTGGNIIEFINPKYAGNIFKIKRLDNTKTTFKSSARLECMMQDYPKLLESGDRVGITQIDRRFCFSTVKNDIGQKLAPESASSCEYDFYWLNSRLLELCGAEIEKPAADGGQSFAGINLNFGARIILSPYFGVTLSEIKKKIKGKVKISAKSTLVVAGDISIENLVLDGSLLATSDIKDLEITDKNYLELRAVDPNSPPYLQIRGYQIANPEKIIKK